MKKPACLGIESSCDETASAIAGADGEILAHTIFSQIPEHQRFGGVVPELAARSHILVIDEVVRKTLADANLTIGDIDVIAATAGPGLIGGVIVGWEFAAGLAMSAGKPLVAVNHLEGHALVPRLTEKVAFPYLLLLASGGHTQISVVRGVGKYEMIGETLDDSAGEAFDKVAKMLGLGYPGGPAVERAALGGNPAAFGFPRPLCNQNNCDFSFSGIKTAARAILNKENIFRIVSADAFGRPDVKDLRSRSIMMIGQDEKGKISRDKFIKNKESGKSAGFQPQFPPDICAGIVAGGGIRPNFIADFCASFQQSVVDVVINRLERAAERVPDVRNLVAAGGVAANLAIRAAMERLAADRGMRFAAPPLKLCTDNGAMIAWAGIENYSVGNTVKTPIAPRPRWPLSEL